MLAVTTRKRILKYADSVKEGHHKNVTKRLRKMAIHDLKITLKNYEDFANGEIYALTAEKNGEEVGNCGGFFGDSVDTRKKALNAVKEALS